MRADFLGRVTDPPSVWFRLLSLDRAEQAKRHKEEARNVLEAYTYRVRDLLNGGSTDFIAFSTEEERNKLSELLETTSSWLAEESDQADTAELNGKKEALE